MTIAARQTGAHIVFYDDITLEQVSVIAPIVFSDDFLGAQLQTDIWAQAGVASGDITLLTGIANGAVRLNTGTASGTANSTLWWHLANGIDGASNPLIEFRVRIPSTLSEASRDLYFGLNHAAAAAAPGALANANHLAVFTADGTFFGIRTDDGTTDTTHTTTVSIDTAWHYFAIDLADLSDVLFYIDGALVLEAQTIDMSGISSSNALMGPIATVHRTSSSEEEKLDIDYIRIWSERDA